MSRLLLPSVALPIAVAAAFVALSVSVSHAATLNLAWDHSPDADVRGYIVYVGSQARVHDESYDVGMQTSFTFHDAAEGRRYYFAVASYTTRGVIGPKSVEISGISSVRPVATAVRLTTSPVPATESIIQEESFPTTLCFTLQPRECYRTRRVAGRVGRVTAMAATPDGRLFFIEDGRRVRVVADGLLLPDAALDLDGSTRLTGLAIDPAFATSRAVLVGQARLTRGGESELTVMRYRELINVLGEGAGIISGLPLPDSAESPLAVDASRRVYVALPALEAPSQGSRGAYNGFVLGFNADGSVPADNRGGSPVLSYGYSRPTALMWNPATAGEVWLSGTDERWSSGLARVQSSASDATEWPRRPLLIPGDSLDRSIRGAALGRETGEPFRRLFAAGSSGRLHLAHVAAGTGALTWKSAASMPFGEAIAVAASDRDVYVAVRIDGSDTAPESFTVLHLTPE